MKNIKILLVGKLRIVPRYIWILLAIICVGTFLRTYSLHGWLEFRGDQVRDSYLVEKVVSGESSWPLLGPYMYNSGNSKELFYHLGPIYYYFQIISGKMFGSFPDKFAYPDVFFSILSIPLFFFFLRLIFGRNLSLGLVAIYSVSSYFIHYSRFAWNSNLIPFFVLLFLYSIYEILKRDRKTPWLWVFMLGFAWGVGFQLHAILMILFSVVVFLAFVLSMKWNIGVWKKWAMVLIIFILLNGGQVVSEVDTNFNNTKRLFNFSSQGEKAVTGRMDLLKNDISCNIEANYFFLSSYGNSDCSYGVFNFFSIIKKEGFVQVFKNADYWFVLLLGIIFSGIGYFLLILTSIKEKNEEKKLFLRLVILYVATSFLIMLPLSIEKFSDLRYLMPVFFLPFILLGLIMNFLMKKYSKRVSIIAIAIIFSVLIFSNIIDLKSEAKVLIRKDRTCLSHITTLGEIESIAKYIRGNLDGKKSLYISGNKELSVAVDPLAYLLKKYDLNPVVIRDENNAILQNSDKPSFLISCRSKMRDKYGYFKVDNIFVYDINSKR